MAVSRKDVLYMADLARLRLTDEEADQLQQDMNNILEYMDLLEQLDTSEVPPLEHVTELHAPLREDKARQPVDHEEALKNAPDADTDYFRVPRVIE